MTGAALVSFATIVGAGFSFITQWLLVRYYSVESFGAFSVSWAAVQALVPLATLGIPQFLILRYKAEQSLASRWLPLAIQWIFYLTGLSVFVYLLLVFGSVQSKQAQIVSLIFIFWFLAVIPVVVVYARYQIQHSMVRLAGWPLVQIVPRTLVVGLIIFLDFPIWTAALGFLLVMLPLSWLAVLDIKKMPAVLSADIFTTIAPERSDTESEVSLKSVVSSSWAFGAAEWLDKLDIRIVVPIVAFLAGEFAAGQFAVAAILLLFIYLVPSAVLQRYLLPHLYTWLIEDPEKLKQFIIKLAAFLLLVSIIFVPIVWLFSPSVIIWVYGDNYLQAVDVFRVLVIAIPIWLLSGVVIRTYLSERAARRLVWIQSSSLAVMFLCIVVLYPQLGLIGIAWALVIERSFLLVFAVLFSGENFKKERH